MIKKIIVKFGIGRFFLSLVIFLYLLTVIININFFTKIILHSKTIIIEVIPTLIVVFILTFLANIFLNNKQAKEKFKEKQSGLLGYLGAIFLGILSTGPIYMWYPLLSELKEDGLKNSLIAIFLYNRSVKIALIPMIIYYFGLPFLIITTILMIIFSLLNGFVIGKFIKNKN